MDHFVPLAFLAAGLILIVLEMASLTLYLGALGVAALLTAVITWFYPLENWQAALVFAVASAIMLPLAHLLRQRMQAGKDHVLVDTDKGSRVTVAETGERGVRVRYRDSLWEAAWEGAGSPQVGQTAEIVARDGARLRIRPVN
ncbi:MAG TPA: NfeD family protein [Gammaproteobacteria bacterium]|jgi:membrane protein implicated in regulation of membrane protease activity|nr:NfeD family protein [Gammaproteobacteria bacterium]